MSEFKDYDIVDRDVALEVMAAMIGTRERAKRDGTSPEIIARLETEVKLLRWERDEIVRGNKELIGKAITIYAKEIQEKRGWGSVIYLV